MARVTVQLVDGTIGRMTGPVERGDEVTLSLFDDEGFDVEVTGIVEDVIEDED